MNDGTKIRANWSASTRRPTSGAEVQAGEAVIAVKFGDSDKLRLGMGDRDRIPSASRSVTAGIVSARNRDISQGPYDNYIRRRLDQRGNSGGRCFTSRAKWSVSTR